MEIYNPKTDEWEEQLQLLPDTRAGLAMVTLDETLTLLGGKSFDARDDAWTYNPLTRQWSRMEQTLREPRGFMGVAEVPITLFDQC